jgi:hypothetical protein
MKATQALLTSLKTISEQLHTLSDNPEKHELDVDAIVDLNLARESVDKLIHRIERLPPTAK